MGAGREMPESRVKREFPLKPSLSDRREVEFWQHRQIFSTQSGDRAEFG